MGSNIRRPAGPRVLVGRVLASHAHQVRYQIFTVAKGAVVALLATCIALEGQQAFADPPPLPPVQPLVPGSQSPPLGPMQLGTPAYPNGPIRAATDARGVGIGTNADLGAPPVQMPNARPGDGGRLAAGTTGPSGGVRTGVTSHIDARAVSGAAPAPDVTPIPVPTVGIDGKLAHGPNVNS